MKRAASLALTLAACGPPAPEWAVAARRVGSVGAALVVDGPGLAHLNGEPISFGEEGVHEDPALTRAISEAMDEGGARSLSLAAAPGLTVHELRDVFFSAGAAGVEDLVLRAAPSSAWGWRTGASMDVTNRDPEEGGMFLWDKAFSLALAPGPDPMLPRLHREGRPDLDALGEALAGSVWRGKGGGSLVLVAHDAVPFEHLLQVVDHLAEAGYDRPHLSFFVDDAPLAADLSVAWRAADPPDEDAPDARTCDDIDALLQRRADLPPSELPARWGERADPGQRSEGEGPFPVKSSVITSLNRPDGGQVLLVACLVQSSDTRPGVGSAQILVWVGADGGLSGRSIGYQDCCGDQWWTDATLSLFPALPGAVALRGAWENVGDVGGIKATKALYLLLNSPVSEDEVPGCPLAGQVPRAFGGGLLVIEEGVVANPEQLRLRTTMKIKGERIDLTERWTPVNLPGVFGGWSEALPTGTRGPSVTTRRKVQLDPIAGRFTEPCLEPGRPDAWPE